MRNVTDFEGGSLGLGTCFRSFCKGGSLLVVAVLIESGVVSQFRGQPNREGASCSLGALVAWSGKETRGSASLLDQPTRVREVEGGDIPDGRGEVGSGWGLSFVVKVRERSRAGICRGSRTQPFAI